MGLEKRKNGRLYYYRTRRSGERVRKQYIASGELAHLIAEQDQVRRVLRELEREREQEEMDHLKAMLASVVEACEAADVLLEAALVASGYHCHKGQWRKARA